MMETVTTLDAEIHTLCTTLPKGCTLEELVLGDEIAVLAIRWPPHTRYGGGGVYRSRIQLPGDGPVVLRQAVVSELKALTAMVKDEIQRLALL